MVANYAERRLALSTQETHSIDLELRIIPRLGDLPLTQLGPSVVERFAADLEREGTGRATIVSTLAVLGRDETVCPRLQPAEQPGEADRHGPASGVSASRCW